MSFITFPFLIFLFLVLFIYQYLPNQKARVILLLAASYIFYSSWNWRFTILIIISTITDFLVGIFLEKYQEAHKRRLLLILSCSINIGILGFFKYFNFFADSFRSFLSFFGLKTDQVNLKVILPIGISFYTLKTLSYTIDIYRRRLKPTHSLLDYALFVAFFPNLVAGPIDKAKDILPQIAKLDRPHKHCYKEALVLITLGLFKKVLIGDAAARIVNNIFGQPEYYLSFELLSALILFSIQIYADFSGYSNIASGLARLFGVKLQKNFEQPYLSRSFSEFWRRWHISLSTWIWDYLFNPIISWLLRRFERKKLVPFEKELYVAYAVATVITMLICGLWHGANYTFIIWGGLHGFFLVFERIIIYKNRSIAKRKRVKSISAFLRLLISWLSTQILIIFAWLFFRAENLDAVFSYLNRMINWQHSEFTSRFIVIVLSFIFITMVLDILEYSFKSELYLLRLPFEFTLSICTAIIILAVLFLLSNKPLPFIYVQF